MQEIIKAKFVRRRFQDSGKDQAPDYYVYEFTSIVDSKGKKHDDKWIKETKLLKAVDFQKGKEYKIVLSESRNSLSYINLPYPIEVSWNGQRVYMKNGNSIVRVSKEGEEKNLSEPIIPSSGGDRYNMGALNKLTKGMMTKELLLKMNSKGIYFKIRYYDLQDRRKFGGCEFGFCDGENNILIQKETEEEIKKDLQNIKYRYVNKEIEKYFIITKELLPPKKKSLSKKN